MTILVEERIEPVQCITEFFDPGEEHDSEVIRFRPVEAATLDDEHFLPLFQFSPAINECL